MRNTYKFHFNSSIGYLTIEQRWESRHEWDERLNKWDHSHGRWEFWIWDGGYSRGENARLTYEESLERLKQIVLQKPKHHPKPFLQYTGCSVHRPLPEPLNIDLT